ncbi:CBM_collapsed_G0013620.mRNA.1.CDS.1 [Saccharomyces cerevisiae]|nr:CBM_collapsed_G0013620.mRNA.1.CDS.1 [Saccharomyces cerevisiae]
MKQKFVLPITPPSTAEKKPQTENRCNENLKPRRLLPQLKSVRNRKPRLSYRPELNSVFDLDAYVDSTHLSKSQRHHMDRDAGFISYALNYSKRMVVVSGQVYLLPLVYRILDPVKGFSLL